MGKKKKRKKRGYTKSKTKDADEQKELEEDRTPQSIDVHYEKGGKKKRKVGKLKLKKPTKKYKNDKFKAGKHKVVNDESWMKQANLKKPAHTVSESIQMLSKSSIVSKKAVDFEKDEDEMFDLSTMDLNVDMSELNAHDHEQRVSTIKNNPKVKKQESMFDQNYAVTPVYPE